MKRLIAIGMMAGLPALSATAQSAGCGQVSTEAILHANGVRAKIMNNGGLFWNEGSSVYTVDGSNALFNANLVVGGLVDGQVRTAGSTYGPYEFWPGPADSINTAADCERFNHMYRIARRDFVDVEESGRLSPDIRLWPWHLGAPVVDGDGDPDNYDPAAGDRPELLGSEMVYWIMNDAGGVHERTGTDPLGIEVHGTAFASPSTDPAIDDATFYRYRIINRSDEPIEEAYAGFYVDPDLGAAFDDYAGSDSLSSLAFAYNADNDDDGNYGMNPPAVGFRTFEGPVALSDGYDNDYDGDVDEPGERLRMSYYVQPRKSSSIIGEPRTAPEFYNYLRGLWRDGLPVTEGGDGRETGRPVRFMYPADPPDFWSEISPGDGVPIPPADRRWIHSVGPFRLAPGEEAEIFFGILYARGADHLDSRNLLEEYAARLDGLRPDDVVADGVGLVERAPEQLVPAHESAGHFTEVHFDWTEVRNALSYELEVESEAASDEFRLVYRQASSQKHLGLEGDRSYRWRVRAYSAENYGPWSDRSTFTVGSVNRADITGLAAAVVTRNASGELAGPVNATATWAGFPGDAPPDERQQAGPARWLLHTYSGGNPDRVTPEDFRNRVYRTEFDWGAEYEIRFTGPSTAWDFQTDAFIEVPFEVWSIGPGTPDDTSDDYRMIPLVIDFDEDGWGLSSGDHPVSDGADDPETDAIYLFEPVPALPGSRGYERWASDTGTEGEDPFDHLGDERLARIVFVNWDAGEPGSGDIAQAIPEEGTIFRVSNAFRPKPILHSPTTDAVLSPDNAVFTWSVEPDEPATLEVARDAGFSEVVLRVTELEGRLSASSLLNLEAGRYYWRVMAIGAGTSETGSFLVGTTLGAERSPDGGHPAILDVYPVPATHDVMVRLRMPVATRADVTVFDVLGRRVLADRVDLAAGESTFSLPVDRLAPGAYFVRLDAAGASLNARIVVAHR